MVSSGIEWVGPPPEVLQLFGDKIQARALAERSNVPVVRGSGNLTSGDECLSILNNGDVRLPAIMKVSWIGSSLTLSLYQQQSRTELSFVCTHLLSIL